MKKMIMIGGIAAMAMMAGCGSKPYTKAQLIQDLGSVQEQHAASQEYYDAYKAAMEEAQAEMRGEDPGEEAREAYERLNEEMDEERDIDHLDEQLDEEFKDSTYDGTQDSLMTDAFGAVQFINPGHDSVVYYVKTQDGRTVYETPELDREHITYWRAGEDFDWGETVELTITMETMDGELFDSATRKVKLVIDEW